MLKVYKYELPIGDQFTLTLPSRSELLDVQLQNGVPCLWALVDPTTAPEERRFILAGTGNPIEPGPNELLHVGTVQLYGGGLVFHLFELWDGQVQEVRPL